MSPKLIFSEIFHEKSVFSAFFKLICVLMLFVPLLYGLLFWAGTFDKARLQKNLIAAEATGIFDKEYPKMFGYQTIDMFTECVAIGIANGLDDDIQNIVSAKMYGSCASLKEAVQNNFSAPTAVYSRYWHGYQVFLKPLYTSFSVFTVRCITAAISIVGLLVLFLAGVKRVGSGYTFLIFVSYISVFRLHVFFLTTHAVQFWLVLLGGIIAFCIQGRKAPILFFGILGGLDAYFSFLNMGSLSLGLPLLCYSLAQWSDGVRSETIVARAFWGCVGWSLGLIFIWGTKWGLSLVFLPEFKLLGSTVSTYTGGLDKFLLAFKNNLEKTGWRIWGPIVLFLSWRFYKKRVVFPKDLWILLLPASIPVVWMMLIPGQAGVIHSSFMCIILWPFLAVLFMLLCAIHKQESLFAWVSREIVLFRTGKDL